MGILHVGLDERCRNSRCTLQSCDHMDVGVLIDVSSLVGFGDSHYDSYVVAKGRSDD